MVFTMNQHFSGGQTEPPSECPRCGSTNTKFCYYNNYNKSQPRHYCKSCKRHWTKGGTLRNIPAGRRSGNKRRRTSAAVSAQPEKLLSLSVDQKNMPHIFYQALIQSSCPSTSTFQSTILESNGTTHTAGSNVSAPQNGPNTEFGLSNLNSLISNPSCQNSDNYQTSNMDNFGENLDSAAECTTAQPRRADLWRWNDEVELLDCLGDLNYVTFCEWPYPWNI